MPEKITPESHEPPTEKPAAVSDSTIRRLALFRYDLRRFLRFSEEAARAAGITPQQHQLLLGIAGFTGTGSATISQLAEFLQEKNNSVIGLVDRAILSGLVHRQTSPDDRRAVLVFPTPRGRQILSTLSRLHHQELRRLRDGLSATPRKSAKSPRTHHE